jgi:exosortase family protein XrtF
MAELRNPFYRFIFFAVALYALWYAAYEFWLKPSSLLDEWVISALVEHSRILFSWFGADLEPISDSAKLHNWIALKGSSGVIVGAPCDGMALFALFSIFIVAFPGPIKHKLWFIPAGILLVHFVNVLRVLALVIIVDLNPEWLSFNHDYTFTILVYAFIFALWYIWVSKFSPLKKASA